MHVQALLQQERLWLHLSRVIVHLLCHEWFLMALAKQMSKEGWSIVHAHLLVVQGKAE